MTTHPTYDFVGTVSRSTPEGFTAEEKQNHRASTFTFVRPCQKRPKVGDKVVILPAILHRKTPLAFFWEPTDYEREEGSQGKFRYQPPISVRFENSPH